MEMNQNNKEQRHSHGGGGGVGGGSLSCSSDLNHSSSSNSNSISLTQSQSQSQSHKHNDDPMHSWWESVSKARSRIRSLVSLLPPSSSSSEEEEEVCSLADSDRPGRALLGSHSAYLAISSSLSGGGDDPLCHWLYDTFQDDDPDLRLFVVSIIPLVAGLYLSRVHCCSTTSPSPGSPSLAGFEAVLLALYSSQAKSRSGKPLVVSIPTPSHLAHHPSLYHHPSSSSSSSSSSPASAAAVGVVCPPLEPQVGIKSTKRATILGVAFHCFYSHISLMPSWSKLDLCRFAASWAGPAPAPDTPLLLLTNDNSNANANANDDDVQIPLPWELLQPMLRILGHCLLAPPPLVSDLITQSASIAVSRLYARASHDLSPQAILATRSLLHLHSRPSPSVSAPTTPTSISNPPDLLLLSA